MKAPPSWGGNVPQGVLQEASQKRKPPIKTKGASAVALREAKSRHTVKRDGRL